MNLLTRVIGKSINSNPLLSNKVNAIVDFSDVHHFTTEGFVKYMHPLLPSFHEVNLPSPMLPPRGHLKTVVACSSSIQDVALCVAFARPKNSRKLNKPLRIKPTHKVYCPSAFTDIWDEDTPPIDV